MNKKIYGYDKFVQLVVGLSDETSTFFSDAPKWYLDYLGVSHLPDVHKLVKNSLTD